MACAHANEAVGAPAGVRCGDGLAGLTRPRRIEIRPTLRSRYSFSMTVQAAPSSLERELEYREEAHGDHQPDQLRRVHPAHPDDAQGQDPRAARRGAADDLRRRHEEPGAVLAAEVGDVPKEIRVPKSFASIAGFTALARKTINIKDAYDAAELAKFHANLRFDQRWDKQTGFRTRAVLAVPILFEKYLLGVLQLINKRHGVAFTAQDEDGAEEIAASSASPSTTSTARRGRPSRRNSAGSSTRASSPRRTSRPPSPARA